MKRYNTFYEAATELEEAVKELKISIIDEFSETALFAIVIRALRRILKDEQA